MSSCRWCDKTVYRIGFGFCSWLGVRVLPVKHEASKKLTLHCCTRKKKRSILGPDYEYRIRRGNRRKRRVYCLDLLYIYCLYREIEFQKELFFLCRNQGVELDVKGFSAAGMFLFSEEAASPVDVAHQYSSRLRWLISPNNRTGFPCQSTCMGAWRDGATARAPRMSKKVRSGAVSKHAPHCANNYIPTHPIPSRAII